MAYELPALSYPTNALEPHIDARTMEIHHTKHHAAYITNANKAIADAGYAAPECVAELCKTLDKVPEAIRGVLRNNGGGHCNHSFFWKIIGPSAGGAPTGKLADAITAKFGSFEAFKAEFAKAAISRFGSGWAWLVVTADHSLAITSTANQDNPLMPFDGFIKGTPILGLDVWEHAYYLHYQNRRADYITAFWNVVNWAEVSARYEKALG
ncbi:MAG: superoxide dismutase [Verrucomicrobiota bacterium]|nr:superoxide dismutase [Verrucomicrobiota bacterium]